MLLLKNRNTILFAGLCLALTIALLDDKAPNRLIENADAVAARRAGEAAALTDSSADFAAESGVWESAATPQSEGLGTVTPEIAPIVAPAAAPPSAIVAQPAPQLPRAVGRQPVAGVRENSLPLGRNYADDGARNMAEDLRGMLG
jgi:hypothetical protein